MRRAFGRVLRSLRGRRIWCLRLESGTFRGIWGRRMGLVVLVRLGIEGKGGTVEESSAEYCGCFRGHIESINT